MSYKASAVAQPVEPMLFSDSTLGSYGSIVDSKEEEEALRINAQCPPYHETNDLFRDCNAHRASYQG